MVNYLILASSSPRRQALLKQIQIPFSIRIPSVDESQITTDVPEERVRQLAMLKGRAMPLLDEYEVILSADTVVAYQNEIFEKPRDESDARRMLSLLSGSIHEVYTGVMIRSATDELTFVEKTKVEFWPLSSAEIGTYVSTNEPYDKAGAYGIQSIGAKFIKQIHGDYFNVVGLPISRVYQELDNFNINL